MNKERFETRMNQILYRLLTTVNNRAMEAAFQDLHQQWYRALIELNLEEIQVHYIESLWQQSASIVPKAVWNDFAASINNFQSELSRHHVLYQKSLNADKFCASLRKLMLTVWECLCECVIKREVAKFETIVRYGDD